MPAKKPKAPFLSPAEAAARLITCAVDHVLCLRPGVEVKWSLRLDYQKTKDFKPAPGQVARIGNICYTSGPLTPPEDEEA